MNQTIQDQLNHRTIRFFQDRPVETEVLETILKVANHTATSVGLQSYSIVRVTDPEIRQVIADVTTQAYVKDVPELFIMIVDQKRNAEIFREKTGQDPKLGMDFFFQGVADAYLAAQNMVNAIESLGMGAVYFGSILNDPQRIVQALKLPDYTFPIVGLGFGYPNDQPELKPRIPMEFKISENHYQVHDNYVDLLADYDQEMHNYYDTRQRNKRSDTYTDQVVQRFKNPLPLRNQLLRVVEKQGFLLDWED